MYIKSDNWKISWLQDLRTCAGACVVVDFAASGRIKAIVLLTAAVSCTPCAAAIPCGGT